MIVVMEPGGAGLFAFGAVKRLHGGGSAKKKPSGRDTVYPELPQPRDFC